ncbi:uncharacterized protein MKK02DRAFT_41192 [Dioszegia hungarica]|uniref:Uncharacterized protein n=1 Tax=Dioszegia hungarica TaxID=4972 RepID=A0AA38LRE7_9TREE|nr:uncharacterized protein MKK02DRAFT_41192 [Dioszegia hungarica]KAI9632880.1 hypothetical protein MKK02DRAFT_41192 [Dioszegia hungarica]
MPPTDRTTRSKQGQKQIEALRTMTSLVESSVLTGTPSDASLAILKEFHKVGASLSTISDLLNSCTPATEAASETKPCELGEECTADQPLRSAFPSFVDLWATDPASPGSLPDEASAHEPFWLNSADLDRLDEVTRWYEDSTCAGSSPASQFQRGMRDLLDGKVLATSVSWAATRDLARLLVKSSRARPALDTQTQRRIPWRLYGPIVTANRNIDYAYTALEGVWATLGTAYDSEMTSAVDLKSATKAVTERTEALANKLGVLKGLYQKPGVPR